MRDKFIPGAGTTYAPGDEGGAVDHTHGFTGDGHTHEMPAGEDILAGVDYNKTSGLKTIIGTTDNGSSLPQYYSLAYIMFIGGT